MYNIFVRGENSFTQTFVYAISLFLNLFIIFHIIYHTYILHNITILDEKLYTEKIVSKNQEATLKVRGKF